MLCSEKLLEVSSEHIEYDTCGKKHFKCDSSVNYVLLRILLHISQSEWAFSKCTFPLRSNETVYYKSLAFACLSGCTPKWQDRNLAQICGYIWEWFHVGRLWYRRLGSLGANLRSGYFGDPSSILMQFVGFLY